MKSTGKKIRKMFGIAESILYAYVHISYENCEQ